MTTWIWQSPRWPALHYERAAVLLALSGARQALGRLLGKSETLDRLGQLPAEQHLWAEDALATAAIEGESLDPAAVRSSIARRLGLQAPAVGASRSTEGLLDVMEDAAASATQPLDHDRLCRWQAALFPTGQSGLRRIVTGRYRSSVDPMQIVSGPTGREVVHFEAVPGHAVQAEMDRFVDWFNAEHEAPSHDGLVFAAIAHVWFETVHPFEDGNGRIGRALVDRAVARDVRRPWRMHGLATRLLKERDDYYDALNRAQRGTVDVTSWVIWFLGAFARACTDSLAIVDEAIERSRYWVRYKHVKVSDRQRKALTKMLDAGRAGFEGGMNLRKYIAITQAARATAQRELSHLVKNEMLVVEGEGRATRYHLPPLRWSTGDDAP